MLGNFHEYDFIFHLCSIAQMRHIATDGVAWSVCRSVCRSVCLLITFVSLAKTVEAIEIPIGGLSRACLMNHVLDTVEIPTGRGNLGDCLAHWKALGVSAVIGSLCCSVRSKRDHPIVNNGMTCNAAFHQSKFFDHLLSSRSLLLSLSLHLCMICKRNRDSDELKAVD